MEIKEIRIPKEEAQLPSTETASGGMFDVYNASIEHLSDIFDMSINCIGEALQNEDSEFAQDPALALNLVKEVAKAQVSILEAKRKMLVTVAKLDETAKNNSKSAPDTFFSDEPVDSEQSKISSKMSL